jgi:hypothetical protein
MKQNKGASAVLDQIYTTRRENLRALSGGADGRSRVGAKLGYSVQYMSQLIGVNPTRDISEKAARTIEEKLDLVNGWLDVAR